ncbi:MAG TPA: Ig-like domain-containing protein, partial [Kiloniellales bacterium]|nr:Ig-like domain-containing protein [Kiloniellales bacterium]
MSATALLRQAVGLCALFLGIFALLASSALTNAAEAANVTLSNTCTTPVSDTLTSGGNASDTLIFDFDSSAPKVVTIVVTKLTGGSGSYSFQIDDGNAAGTWDYTFSPTGSFGSPINMDSFSTLTITASPTNSNGTKRWTLTNVLTGRSLNWTASCQADNRTLTINSVTATPTEYSASGQSITFTYNITNNSAFTTFPASAINIDGTRTVTGGTCGTFSLAAGASGTCTRTYTTQVSDVPNDIVYTLSSATTTATGWTVGLAAPAPSTTVQFNNKSLTINSVSASPTIYTDSGQSITFTYSITNNSALSAFPSSAIDISGTRTVTGGTCGTFSLGIGATGTCTRTYTTQGSDEPNDIVYTLSSATTTASGWTVSLAAPAPSTTVQYPSGATSTITASPTSIEANGSSTSTITVQLKDSSGNNLTTSGGTVALSTTLGTLGSVTDNNNGTYTATLTSGTITGTATITGTINGNAITDNATVTFTAGAISAANSTVDATTPHVADGVDDSTVTIVLRDANNNAVIGLTDGDFVIGLTGSAVEGTVT